mmetsp:Transcript_18834/g.55209  ORF Transcript_18834/g.55209 Transcript_18834/m.55209 type:complete len:239 (+) Transcript_18834:917-1633(+)
MASGFSRKKYCPPEVASEMVRSISSLWFLPKPKVKTAQPLPLPPVWGSTWRTASRRVTVSVMPLLARPSVKSTTERVTPSWPALPARATRCAMRSRPWSRPPERFVVSLSLSEAMQWRAAFLPPASMRTKGRGTSTREQKVTMARESWALRPFSTTKVRAFFMRRRFSPAMDPETSTTATSSVGVRSSLPWDVGKAPALTDARDRIALASDAATVSNSEDTAREAVGAAAAASAAAAA